MFYTLSAMVRIRSDKDPRMDPAAAALAFAIDGMTAAAGAFNAAWLTAHAGSERTARRAAALLALAVLNAAAAIEALFAQALYSAHRFGGDIEPYFAPGAWLAVRLPMLAGTLLISLLILRKAASS
jgi:hypothetical protein